jgi:uncharacterized membrane protein YphA (DoxX/SURF4 family)
MFYAGRSVTQVIGHVLVGSVFLSQALGTLPRRRFAGHSKKLAQKGFPFPNVVLSCALAMMLVGGIMVIADIYSEIGALLLIIFTLIATYLYQNFLTVADPEERRKRRGVFFNNLAILGGLFLLLS